MDLSFCFHSPLEFLTSMYVVANKARIERLKREFSLPDNMAVDALLEGMRGRLSRYQSQELDFFFRQPEEHTNLFCAFLNFVYHHHPDIADVPQFLAALAEHDIRTALNYMLDMAYEEGCPGELSAVLWQGEAQAGCSRAAEAFALRQELSASEKDRLGECLGHPQEAVHRFLFLLEGFYERAYLPVEQEIRELAAQAIPRYQSAFDQNPEAFFLHMIKTEAEGFTKAVRIHLSPIIEVTVSIVITSEGLVDWIQIGAHTDVFFSRQAERETVEKFLKAVGDKTRLEIVTQLAKRSWYGQELAELMGMTAAAVSYHMGLFFELDMVHIKREGHRYYYALNKDSVENLFAMAERAILGNP